MKIVYKHPLMTRWNHWINFPAITIMVWSGMLIYWANPAYFIPGEWLDAIGWNYGLAKGMSWHFAFGVLFVVNGVSYVLFLIFSGNWRYLFPDRHSFKNGLMVFLHDFRIYKGPLPEQIKYNGAQRITYTIVIGLGMLAVLTGFAIYKPVQLSWLAGLFGGYSIARIIHFLIALSFVAFFVVHIIQVLRSGWNSIRAMIIGVEKKSNEP